MIQIDKRKTISQPLRPFRVDFCYISPLQKQQFDVIDPQIMENTIINQTHEIQRCRKEHHFKNAALKDKTNCDSFSEENSTTSVSTQLTKLKRKYLDDYLFLGGLGKGAYGRVEKLKSKENNCIYAGKTLHKSSSTESNKYKNKRLQNEIKIYQKLIHTNIPQLYQVYTWKNQYTLLMEYVSGSNLHVLLEDHPNEEKKIARVMYQILDALEYLHNQNIVHHDLKPENIIFDTQTEIVKIVDFGESIQMNTTSEIILRQGGTYSFFAPEYFQNICSGKIDIWACGIILYYLLDGVIYFYDQNREEMKKKILSKPVQFQGYNWNHRSQMLKDLISKILEKDYRKRISAAQAKEHPWIVENCRGWQNPSKNVIKAIIRPTQNNLTSERQNMNEKQRKISWESSLVKGFGPHRKQSRFYSDAKDV